MARGYHKPGLAHHDRLQISAVHVDGQVGILGLMILYVGQGAVAKFHHVFIAVIGRNEVDHKVLARDFVAIEADAQEDELQSNRREQYR